MKALLLLSFIVPIAAFAEDANFDSLGGNHPILERAKAISSEKNVTIVQNRTVSRINRFELAPEFSGTFGGDAYNRTKSVGANVHFHINPNWSFGAKYEYSFNTLTPEGKAMVDGAIEDFKNNPSSPDSPYPAIDYPKSQMLALVNWYPFYGKLNLLDRGVAHFDFYGIAGAGQVQLYSGSATTYTGGLGLAFWLSRSFSMRMETRYQTYTSKTLNQDKKLDLTVASMQVGWLL